MCLHPSSPRVYTYNLCVASLVLLWQDADRRLRIPLDTLLSASKRTTDTVDHTRAVICVAENMPLSLDMHPQRYAHKEWHLRQYNMFPVTS